ncbi:MAG TPA: ROK family protein [Candidatus Dormibacteraeota bacterium]|nr:ROK family protein [Candidatus Dormibacteraeota bacterium]
MSAAFVGVDLGGTQIRAALAHDPSRLDARVQRPTPAARSADVEAALVEAVREAARGERIAAVGVGAPGPLDPNEGIVHEAPNLPGFVEIALTRDMSGALGVPVFLDRDTVVAAYAEAAFGAARGVRDWMYITISTGIGGTIVTGGKVLRGVTGTSGEIGHFPIDPNGPPCGCGNNGCVEALAGGANMAKHFGVASAAEVFEAWRRGDARAAAIVSRAERALGDMAVGVVNLLNPARIVVGGGIASGEPEFVFGAMRRAVRERAFAVPAGAVEIVPAQLGDEVGLFGAALMARERVAGRQPLD